MTIIGLLLSSIAFGYTHIYGYGVFKFFPAFVMGIILGWLFLRYGVLASVSYHCIYNSILITGGFYFQENASLIRYGLIPAVLLVLVAFFEFVIPMNTSFLDHDEISI